MVPLWLSSINYGHCSLALCFQFCNATCKLVTYCTLYLNSTKQLKQLHWTGKDDKAAQKLHIWGLKRKHLEVRKNAIAMCILQGVKKNKCHADHNEWQWREMHTTVITSLRYGILHKAHWTNLYAYYFHATFHSLSKQEKKKKFCKVNKYSQTPVLQYCLVNHMQKKKTKKTRCLWTIFEFHCMNDRYSTIFFCTITD